MGQGEVHVEETRKNDSLHEEQLNLKRRQSSGQRMPLGIPSTWRAPQTFLTFFVAPLLLLLAFKLWNCNCPPTQLDLTVSPPLEPSQILAKAPELKMSNEQTYVNTIFSVSSQSPWEQHRAFWCLLPRHQPRHAQCSPIFLMP